MFEKEAEEKGVEYADKQKRTISIHEDSGYSWGQVEEGYENGFKDGAEFGFNKANEWHYHGVPNDNKPYLCKVKHPTNYDQSEYEILFFDDTDMSWFRWLTLWSGKEGNERARINRKVIAWKEIIFPNDDLAH